MAMSLLLMTYYESLMCSEKLTDGQLSLTHVTRNYI